MNRTEEFQEEYSEIEKERGGVPLVETTTSLRILVVKMLREMSGLEETFNYLLGSPRNIEKLRKMYEQGRINAIREELEIK
jgi:hypothetical protein